MAFFGWIVIILLTLILGLLVWIAVHVMNRFRSLSAARLAVYLEYSEYVNSTMYCLRRDEKFPKLDPAIVHKIELIGSRTTTEYSLLTLDAFQVYMDRLRKNAPPAEIAGAQQAAQKALINLNLAMRKDIALTTDVGRFPNAEFFRRSRATSGKSSS